MQRRTFIKSLLAILAVPATVVETLTAPLDDVTVEPLVRVWLGDWELSDIVRGISAPVVHCEQIDVTAWDDPDPYQRHYIGGLKSISDIDLSLAELPPDRIWELYHSGDFEQLRVVFGKERSFSVKVFVKSLAGEILEPDLVRTRAVLCPTGALTLT
jgi:hypothetical protein